MDRRIFLGVALSSVIVTCPETQSLAVCKGIGPSGQCRYLGEDDDGYACLKGNSKCRPIIDEEVASYLAAHQGSGKIHNVPLGNNCVGISPDVRIAG